MSENAAETMTAKATTEAALDVNKKLPVWKKIGYSFGEIGSQCSWTLISSYLTVFYTDVVGLTPVVISAIMLIARIWDAINDPMFGAIAENTKTRWGRFRPYILWGAPILALFNCLTFLNLDIPNSWKAIWCGFTYIGCGMAYTAVNISTQCVANVMTASNQERVSLNAYKGIGSGLIQMVISAVTMPMILHFGNGSASSSRGYFMAALVFSIVCVPCFWVCFASSKEIIGRKADAKKETIGGTMKNLAASFKYTFKNRDAVFLMLAMFTFLTGLFGRIGIMAYYFIYIMGDPLLIAGFATAMSFGMLVVNFYAPLLLNRMSKKYVGAMGCVAQALCCVFFYVIGQNHLTNLVVISGFLYGVTNVVSITCFTLSAEIIDDSWLKTGIRSDGVIASCISFSTKLGNAIGGSIGILALGAVGFVANATDLSANVLTNMNKVINFAPAGFFVVAAVLFLCISITRAKAKENEEKLAAKIAAGELS
ncbi:MAG: glycoside-pentoside-hexuronide (GPH):cation symporter [Lachnospiraceae bacterium]|uniref:MFS transporter n=1 Tax=Mediterraneibacter glycyrrhizinilyticus TaxID=342942 RepID=UPI0006D0E8FC|nr:glycoside-pentoside-hexuronide (GPH):cation symporter [Mediterraneibacter glycyrrhizinilyticus]MBS5325909.1 glycoside-pentoside-hexuronide (GPH):cation symporter [Lachnospiraceae bacterium]MCB6308405.1 glycoside-pentoside-hexuronide (GPH):cation symporter [Lachnospiraceae bacterium 210521-DFI.1.109]MCB6426709.1 glycoside-pentoside-hexuronide (GPH):cation symporter [Mediterraneibacter glycyrrhizinilyticus]